MPRTISGTRFARSSVTPIGAQVASRVLDFQLGPRMGLEIFSVQGSCPRYGSGTLLVADNATGMAVTAQQSLHMETGALEDLPISAGEDADDIDTEVFYLMGFALAYVNSGVAGEGATLTTTIGPTYVAYTPTLFLARNLTHRGETVNANDEATFNVLIQYRYIEFTDAEMGIVLARRS